MKPPSLQELLHEREELRNRLEEAEGALRALRAGEVDAVVVDAESECIYTLEVPDRTYRLLIEQMPHAAATLTEEGAIIHGNRRFCALLDRPPHALIGKPLQSFVDPARRAALEQQLKQCLAAPVTVEVELQPPSGLSLPPLHLGLTALEEGARGTCLLLEDLTQQRYVQELERTQEALRAADRMKDEFLATLAHELRSPLAPIRNALEILKLDDSSPATREMSRGILERQVQLMSRLLEDLLDVSRISRKKLELRKQRVSLESVLDAALETSRPVMEAAGHKLAVRLPPDPVFVEADPVRLAQVFANLLNNAAKYTTDSGRTWLGVAREGGEAVVSVKDSGIGIAADMLPHLFEIFSQAEPALERSQGGLGIGLSLAKGIVDLHGGTIEARSGGLGRGSEFIVRLPLAAEPAEPSSPPKQDEQSTVTGLRILIVDDNRDSAESMAWVFARMSNDVNTAYDGHQAVQLAEEWRPDVVLLDLGMPHLNGYEACRRIRAQPWGADMCLVALTGWGQAEDRRRTEEAGFDHHMVKPVDPAHLLRMLASAPRLERLRLRAVEPGAD